MKQILTVAALMMGLAVPGIALAEAGAPGDAKIKVMTVEHSAHRKPPFQRRWVEVAVSDVAMAEPVAATEMVDVKTVRMGANRKAPFKREVVSVPVVDTAMMEIDDAKPKFRGRPPFNRHQ